ncbi:MAG: acyl-CoA thioesterase [Pseudomonadota bacterium]
MTELLTYRGVVYPWQCDHMGHMNVMHYMGKFDEAAWNMFAEIGLTQSYIQSSGRGMAAVQINISYKRELLAGEIIDISSRMLEVRDKLIRFSHEMRTSGETAAIAELTAVHLDRTARKACAFEPGIRAKADALLAQTAA